MEEKINQNNNESLTQKDTSPDESRRTFLKGTVGTIAAGSALGLMGSRVFSKRWGSRRSPCTAGSTASW